LISSHTKHTNLREITIIGIKRVCTYSAGYIFSEFESGENYLGDSRKVQYRKIFNDIQKPY
jgi:hypothetical protein